MPKVFEQVAAEYPDYLRDESRKMGCADAIAFPESEAEVAELLAAAGKRGTPVTVQGARTGLTGGAVPDGGLILNLSRMNRILGVSWNDENAAWRVRVQPGLLLAELRSFLAGEGGSEQAAGDEQFRRDGSHFFPTDPTETTASLGGMAACNASGALSFRYGAFRRHCHALRVVLADGDMLALERGVHRFAGDELAVHTERGRAISCRRPNLAMPAGKHAAGYFSRPDMDAVDLFIGAEGTLGVITELDLLLSPSPACAWGAVVFLPHEPAAVSLVVALRESGTRPAALEYFSPEILELLHRHRETHPGFEAIPALPSLPAAAVYVEYHHAAEEDMDGALEELVEKLAGLGGDPDQAWVAMDSREMARLKAFRHAAPECVNVRLDQLRRTEPRLTKLSTDLAVPDGAFSALLERYRRDLDASGMEYALFGHAGDNHLHVNILPRDMDEYEAGAAIYREWARLAVELGGTVSAEHGIGKLKRAMLEIQFSARELSEMRRVKELFDPAWILNSGTFFTAA